MQYNIYVYILYYFSCTFVIYLFMCNFVISIIVNYFFIDRQLASIGVNAIYCMQAGGVGGKNIDHIGDCSLHWHHDRHMFGFFVDIAGPMASSFIYVLDICTG